MKTVGRFSFDRKSLTGPAAYMKERGNERLDRILAGDDEIFKMFCENCPDAETAVLVLLQTDYAGWVGEKELFGRMGG